MQRLYGKNACILVRKTLQHTPISSTYILHKDYIYWYIAMHSFEDQLYKEKFQGKYRVKSARLSGFNYSANGAYFVTICTKNRRHFFGKIYHKKMLYSDAGNLACLCWKSIPDHFPFVRLGEWIIMPNHVHGIIWIDKNPVETLHAKSLRGERKTSYSGEHSNFSSLSPKKYSLSSIIRSYKSAVS